MIQPRIAASVARQSILATLGAELLHGDAGLCRIAAPLLPGFLQQHGYGHAGVTFTLGDSSAGYAALSVMPEGAEVLTAEMKINLLAPAQGERLVAEGRVLRAGRRLVVVAAEVRADDALIAVLQGTMIPV
jgi:uncharacterized protein (TIGR00369 family)